MKIYILSLFPDQLSSYFFKGILKKAYDAKRFDIVFLNIRDFATDKHRTTDDYPFGGKKGMLLKVDVLYNAVTSIEHYNDYRILYTCPKGQPLNQHVANTLNTEQGLIIICGYYEGVDERIFELFDITRISAGDVILSSGELPALMIAESVIRQIPDVLGNPDSFGSDSILTGLLEYPQYTAPRSFMEKNVPDVILSGHHKQIENWRLHQSLKHTLYHRPRLLTDYPVSQMEKECLAHILKEEHNE